MFEEVGKVFSRGFLVGFFLPGMLFILGNVVLLNVFFHQLIPAIQDSITDFLNLGYGPALILAAWIIGVTLLAVNRVLIRVLEGYHILRHTRMLSQQQNQFDALNEQLKDVVATGRIEKKKFGDASEQTKRLFEQLTKKRISSFPLTRDSVLATSFGNTIRAFEEYSYRVYKIDAIPFWPRMMAVVPEEYKSIIGDAKSQVDAAINIFYLALLLGIESFIAEFLVETNHVLLAGFLGMCLLFAALSYQVAISSARQWGETVKSVFDLYRYDLLHKLGIQPATTWAGESEQWELLSKSFLFQYPLDKLARVDHTDGETNSPQGGQNA